MGLTKIRETNSEVELNPSGTGVEYDWDGNPRWSCNYSRLVVPTEESRIVSVSSPDRNKPCFHRRYKFHPAITSCDRWDVYPPGSGSQPAKAGPWNGFDARSIVGPSYFSMGRKCQDIMSDHSYVANAVFQSLPKVEDIAGGFSLANFLLELREIKTLFSNPFNQSTAHGSAAKAHLQWSFGWKPFLSDLQKIWKGLVRMDKIIDRWNADAKKGKVYTFTNRLEDKEEVFEDTAATEVIASGSTWRHVRTRHENKEEEIRLISYVTPRHIDWDASKHVYRFKAMGLHKPLSVIWEAVPFSFVVDWFLTIGDTLDKLEQDGETLPLAMLEVTLSHKLRWGVSSQFAYQTNLNGWDGWWTMSQSVPVHESASLYERRVFNPPHPEPDLWEWPVIRLPGVRQVLLGISLLTSLIDPS